MHLEKLEIQGFKSFAPKTTINLDRGITAIVGPNGSGKSNVADAIRWVMGEQSIKNLRGKKSEDIIFAGSNAKGKMGMAEVSLYLNNEDSRVPIDYSQVVLTRRLYRSGESEYLLNRSKVRLLDIHELLAKAGFGQKTYSVIGQGMIDVILRSGPKERREMFEEAAGIKHFQLKRNSSLNKLERTKHNLVRVGDLLNEIGPRRNSLKRQASRAMKKDEIRQELKVLQEEYFNYLWNKNREKIDAAAAEGAVYLQQEKDIEKEINNIKLKLNQAEENIDYSREDELLNKLNKLNGEKNSHRERLAMIEGRIEAVTQKDLSIGWGDFEKSRSSLTEEKNIIVNDLKNLQAEKNDLQERMASNIDKIEQIDKEKIVLDGDLEALRSQAESGGLMEINQDISQLSDIQNNFFADVEDCKNLDDLELLKQKAKGVRGKIKEIFRRVKDRTGGSSFDQEQLRSIQGQLENIIKHKIELEQDNTDIKIKLAVIDNKIENQQQAAGKNEKELKEITDRMENFTSEDEGENLALKQLSLDKEVWQKKFDSITEEVTRIEEELKQERIKERSARKDLFEMEKEYRDFQEKLNNVRNNINQNQIKMAGLENDRKLIVDEIVDNTSQEEYHKLIILFEKNPLSILPEREQELKQKIGKMRKQMIAIGEIDPQVVTEYEECEKRYTYLFGQKDDLEKAMESLKKVIAELDETINEKFNIAFKNINEQFQKYFEVLFGGGRAKLIKKKVRVKEGVDHDDQEETEEINAGGAKFKEEEQIEILATPPGKKLKNLGMLSGGERALTSIALLFAIITNNPAPFMVLDEVDAALDESNSSRYADIVTSLADKSQFIIITHNRETMRRASLLYGVTMEQSGISKLLSVKLDSLPNN